MLLRRTGIVAAILCFGCVAGVSRGEFDVPWEYAIMKLNGPYSVEDRLTQFGPQARARLAPHFAAAGVPFPPQSVAILAFKDALRLELYARGVGQSWMPIRAYAVLAASGGLGPKLREGDKQVPEGLYRVTLLNANSRFHVSLRLDYPNAFDLRMAQLEGRRNLGRDIMIHGKDVSAGCLAIGDEAAEELFTLAAMVMPGAVHTVISPTDFRSAAAATVRDDGVRWTAELYTLIRSELANYPVSERLVAWSAP
jgi:hypothetical protein